MEKSDPPKWADWFVTKICPEEYLEEVQGDLHEAFYWRSEVKGARYARRKFYFESLKTIRLFRLKIPDFMQNLHWAALKNYFRTGLRFLWKTRTYSGVNMLGLAIGIATAAMAYLFLADQYAYDRYHSLSDQLFRLTCSMEYNGETYKMGGASYIMGEELPKQTPGIAKSTHIKSGLALRKTGENYEYQYFHYADRELFDMLDFTFVSGGPGAFENPDRILVSESFARKLSQIEELRLLFGTEEKIFTIAGIFKDLPRTSTLRPQILIPFSFWVNRVAARRTVNWFDINMNVFVLKNKDISEERVVDGLNRVLKANYDISEGKERIGLQPFSEMHTDNSLELGNGLRPSANRQILSAVLGIGLLCLLIACFNYSNFALGNFLSRSKEVAIRKVMGANKTAIFQQFISESFLSTAIAGVFAIVLIQLALPGFSLFVEEEYTSRQLLSRRFVSGFVFTLFLSAFLSGLYPALVLSSKKASLALRNKLKIGSKSLVSWFLVALQVSLTIFLIIGMITVGRQFNHLIDFDLGYSDENILTIEIMDSDEQKLEQFKKALSQIPSIKAISANSGYNGVNYEQGALKMETSHLRSDEKLVDLLDLKLIAGRNFDPAIRSDQREAVMVNETFVKLAGLETPVGKRIPFKYGELENPQVIGIVKDFRYDSPKTALEPLVIYTSPQYQLQELMVKLHPAIADFSDLLNRIEDLWRESYPKQPFRYSWLEEINEANMQTELQVQKLSRAGSLIAILLASLGLFGVAGAHVRQRLKEVSIRKVNGASPLNIYWLFSRKFGQWLLLGFVFGAIPAMYFLHNWLQNYPERISLNIGIPIISALICSLVFLAIISWLLLKVVYMNPIAHLRDE